MLMNEMIVQYRQTVQVIKKEKQKLFELIN